MNITDRMQTLWQILSGFIKIRGMCDISFKGFRSLIQHMRDLHEARIPMQQRIAMIKQHRTERAITNRAFERILCLFFLFIYDIIAQE